MDVPCECVCGWVDVTMCALCLVLLMNSCFDSGDIGLSYERTGGVM